ncbi:glycoside hydrolase superfamily [Massariosphaeria phaeospora]|uniref:alpha-galactosidase n=1 Tax=Massariosphaeria phaeospora TaxID=100035 RepID=A0A7C8MG54_9PLEO|nr:glycoside hydrolase superfamily [Massariosphaeria phaeospora]
MGGKSLSRPWSLRKKLLVGVLVAVVVLGLALGLGLGLTVGREDGDGQDGSQPTATGAPLPSPTARLPWRPQVNESWQIVLQNSIVLAPDATSVTPDVSIFDVDLFDTSKETIDTLHRLGKKVICYFSGGSYEPGRPDSGEFEDADSGKELDGWPGEKWLKLSSANVRRIMKGRVELAHQKGCDGVDPDNVDGFQNDNGVDLTAEDSIAFISYLSNITAPFNLTLGLKNAGDIISNVLPVVHFSVNEQCVQYSECDTFAPFIEAGKPVFHIEYPDDAGSTIQENEVDKYCGDTGDAEGRKGFSTVMKKMDLDGWVEDCDRKVGTTAVNATKASR